MFFLIKMESFSVPLRYAPVVFAVILVVSIFLSYVIAVAEGQVYPFLPSISRTAAFEPGGSLFSLLLTFVILSALVLISVRYLQVQVVAGKSDGTNIHKWIDFNATSYLFGIVMVFGIAVVASFRCPLTKEEEGTVGTVHYLGSAIMYFSGTFYICFQTIIAFYLDSRRTFVTRLAVTLVYCVTGVTFLSINAVALSLFDGSGDPANIPTWHPGQGGYGFHVVSCAGEWISILSLAVFALTFCQELREFQLELRCSSLGHVNPLTGDTKGYNSVDQQDSTD